MLEVYPVAESWVAVLSTAGTSLAVGGAGDGGGEHFRDGDHDSTEGSMTGAKLR